MARDQINHEYFVTCKNLKMIQHTEYNIQQQHIFTTMDDDTLLPTWRELDVDLTFEIEEFDSTSVTGDGLLYYPDNSSLMDNSNPFTKALLLRRLIQYFLTHHFVDKRQIVAWIRKKISISEVHDRSPFIVFFVLA